MAGPQNGIIGDDYGIDIPETQMVEDQLVEEKKAAKYSRSGEFKKLQAHMQSRIEFYQSHLPDGTPVASLRDPTEVGNAWQVANSIITEFAAVLNFYETAAQTVKDAENK